MNKKKRKRAPYMRRYRERKRKTKHEAQDEILRLLRPKEIRRTMPALHEFLWGKPKKKRGAKR